MKSFYARGVLVALGLIGFMWPAAAQEPFGSSSLLPLPSIDQRNDVVTPTAYGYRQEEISPSDQVKPAPGLSQSFAPPVELSPDYQGAMKQNWDAPPGCTSSCGDASCGGSCGRCCNKFFAYGGALVMGRANSCDVGLTQAGGTYLTVLDSGAVNQQWAGGFEVGGGYVLPGCCNAISFGYWGLFPASESAYVNASNYTNIQPIMGSNLNLVDYNDGTTTRTAQSWMTTSTGRHEINQNFNFNSVEMNFLGNSMAWGAIPCCGQGGYACMSGCNSCCTPRWQFGWLAGVRYFNYTNGFNMFTDYNDTTIDGDPDELRYYLRTNNNLWGFQMGGQGTYCISKCFSLYGGARFGVYNNSISSSQFIQGSNGFATINSGTYTGSDYNFNSSANALAGLGQLDLGMTYNIGCHWSLYGGYRVVGITGLANAPSQIPNNFADASAITHICATDSVILHGATAGVIFRW